MTHLHLRRASSLQTAFYTVSLWDYPNFEHLCHSDVKQISGRVANPVASPKPDVGIHFEVITKEGPIVIPLCFSNSLGEPHIHPGCLSHTHTNPHRHTQATMSPDLAKFTQLCFQELEFTLMLLQEKRGGKEKKKLEVCRWRGGKSSSPPRAVSIPYTEMTMLAINSAVSSSFVLCATYCYYYSQPTSAPSRALCHSTKRRASYPMRTWRSFRSVPKLVRKRDTPDS